MTKNELIRRLNSCYFMCRYINDMLWAQKYTITEILESTEELSDLVTENLAFCINELSFDKDDKMVYNENKSSEN